MVRVCDAIMGSGKTSATIGYINAHPEKKFLYITPYLPEAERIKNNCPQADFVEPSDRIPEFLFSKDSAGAQYYIDTSVPYVLYARDDPAPKGKWILHYHRRGSDRAAGG